MRRDGLTIKVANMPDGVKDVAELLNSDGGEQAYERMIAEAQPAMVWMVEHIAEKYELESLDALEKACDFLVQFLVAEHPVARAKYIEQIAAKLDAPPESVWEAFFDMLDRLTKHYVKHEQQKPQPDFKPLD